MMVAGPHTLEVTMVWHMPRMLSWKTLYVLTEMPLGTRQALAVSVSSYLCCFCLTISDFPTYFFNLFIHLYLMVHLVYLLYYLLWVIFFQVLDIYFKFDSQFLLPLKNFFAFSIGCFSPSGCRP